MFEVWKQNNGPTATYGHLMELADGFDGLRFNKDFLLRMMLKLHKLDSVPSPTYTCMHQLPFPVKP